MNSKGVNYYVEAGKRASQWHSDYIKKMKECRFDTIAVHGIYSMQEALDFNQGSIIEPMYMSSSQGYRDSDEMEAALSYQIPTWCYSRIGNPSMYYLEGVLALIEGYGCKEMTTCCATSSGMAAIQSACDPFLTTENGQEEKMNFVATCQVYGGTFQQFAVRKDQERNIEWRKVINSNNIEEWEALIDENTRFLYGEMPSNPGQSFFDLEKVAALARKHGIPMIVDSTVATPALMRPLQWGADIVVQSVTKTLTSSGFGISGALIAKTNLNHLKIKNDALKENFGMYIKALPNRDNGPNISPMNAILTINDIRTLRSKIDLMSRNTMKVAKFLEGHKHIEQVDYLGLESHPLHKLASKYMVLVDSEYDDLYNEKVNRFGHLMSFRVKGGAQATRKVFDGLQRIWRATDLGRIKSVATIPAISTHQQQGEEGRKLADIPANLIRLCVGAEHADDIIADIDQALSVLDGKVITKSAPEYSAGGASSASLR